MVSVNEQKRNAAAAAIAYVENKMIVGLGTGSTAEFALRLLAERVASGLRITGVPSSIATARLARRLRIPLIPDEGVFKKIDLAFDGADEVDPQLNLIKGGGGAMTREKVVATRSARVIIMIDQGKLVKYLGKFPLPVEVLPFGWRSTAEMLRSLGARVGLRVKDRKVVRTDNGNFVLDCGFRRIPQANILSQQIHQIAGIVDHGIFAGVADLVIVGKKDGGVDEHWAT
jgi:ribose 5-phosphate isomerase A